MTLSDKKLQAISETKLLVKLFLKTNESDINLSKITGISSSTVGRRLTNKEVILECYPENGENIYGIIMQKREENSIRGKKLGTQMSILSNKSNDDIKKINLDSLFTKESLKNKFLVNLALHFRAKPALLASLFNIDERKIFNELVLQTEEYFDAFKYLMYVEEINEDIVKSNIIAYFKELFNAIKNKDEIKRKELLELIFNGKINKFYTVHKSGDNLSNQDILMLVNYQLKYAISNRKMSEIFKIGSSNYRKRVRELLKDNIDLITRYEKLTDYYKERSIESERSI